MPRKTPHVPSYRLHKPTGQARVIIGGQHIYLGRHGTAESEEKYRRLIAEHFGKRASPLDPPEDDQTDITISELIARYWIEHVQNYYAKDGKPTDRQYHIRLALRPLAKLYGRTPASEFGPLAAILAWTIRPA